jgi:hypothetical protein
MISHLKRIFDYARPSPANGGLHFDRPLLLFQSDDWGRVGVRDREGWDELQAGGIALGESPYDFYSLETAEDVTALRELMGKHRDSAGRNPSIVMNFIMANVDMASVDFEPGRKSPGKEIPLVPLCDGLPGRWQRAYLLEAYQQGIKDRIFYPALHGLTHFCEKAVGRVLAGRGERAESIRNELIWKMWSAQTPYIYWRMPWIGYEYWDPAMEPERRFLSLDEQHPVISRAAEIYRTLFAAAPFSACAPGYRANADTRAAWFDSGIRVAQNGPASKAPHFDEHGMLHTFRTIEMEPAIAPVDLKRTLEAAGECFQRGLPAVVSIHSINFHSTIRDFRTPTLVLLDEFLTALEKKWPTLLYVNDADLFRITSEGMFFADGERVDVGVSAA